MGLLHEKVLLWHLEEWKQNVRYRIFTEAYIHMILSMKYSICLVHKTFQLTRSASLLSYVAFPFIIFIGIAEIAPKSRIHVSVQTSDFLVSTIRCLRCV